MGQMAHYEPGDLIFFWGHGDWISWGIRWATWGPSHVGMVVRFRPEGLLLVEATTLLKTPCLVMGNHAGVQANDIEQRIGQYTADGGKAELWRLAPKHRLSDWEIDALSANAYYRYLGKAYDPYQAVGSATNIVKWWLKKRLGWAGFGADDRTKFFCSETSICQLQDLNRFLQDKVSKRRWEDVNPSDYSPAEFQRSIRNIGLYHREEVFV